jgi:TATA-box binding protein (TBP) (component of TFIID and TFIIIB)
MLFDYKVSTITLCTSIPGCELNTFNISKYLPINDFVIGIGYNGVTRGEYPKGKKSFYNQVSILVKYNGKLVNVKVFKNGSLQVTGCKTEQDGKGIYEKLYSILKEISDMVTVNVDIIDGVPITVFDGVEYIYSFETKSVIGTKTLDGYIINRGTYTTITINGYMYFISVKHFTKKRNMLFLNGELAGFSKIKIKNSRLYSNPGTLIRNVDNRIYSNDNCIGEIIYTVNDYPVVTKYNPGGSGSGIYEYNCSPFITIPRKVNIETSINCINIFFNIQQEINRKKLYEYLVDNDWICNYNPNVYSGIRLVFKIPYSNENILKDLSFSIVKNKSDILCYNVVFLIFHSGAIIVSGLKSTNSINSILGLFSKVVRDYETIKNKNVGVISSSNVSCSKRG